MKFSTTILALVSATTGLCQRPGGAVAGGQFPGGPGGHFGKCLKPADTEALVAAYQRLIAAYKPEDADKYLTANFIEYSDSINSLAGIPLGSPTFPNRDAFKAAQASNPPFPLAFQGEPAVACTKISLIWSGVFGKGNPVRGIAILETIKEGEEWKISRLDTEFNSIAWLLDIGGLINLPPRP